MKDFIISNKDTIAYSFIAISLLVMFIVMFLFMKED